MIWILSPISLPASVGVADSIFRDCLCGVAKAHVGSGGYHRPSCFYFFIKSFHFLWFENFLRVSANLARWPNFPDFFAADANFFAGIFLPFLIPSDFRNAPGFLIASAIFSFGLFVLIAMIYSYFLLSADRSNLERTDHPK